MVGALAILAAGLGMFGCSSTQQASEASQAVACPTGTCAQAKFEQDRAAILGMAGEYDVTFSFEETIAVRGGYERAEPYTSKASELVKVIEDTGGLISMQHLLVVEHDGEQHIVKHWRQDWRYQGDAGYDFKGENRWEPVSYTAEQAKGAWVQSVYQVDDSPRYWGIAKWQHRDGVSTWSAATNRPLPRREFSKRKDYQVLGAVNTHVVTPGGWMHYQNNYKLDTKADPADTQPVIALESGVNTYTKTTATDFSKAEEYWQNTAPYWAEVRAAWAEVFGKAQTLKLKNRVKGDQMHTFFFDMADLYWGEADVSDVRAKATELIGRFRETEAVAMP